MFSSNDTVLNLLKENNVILTQIADNFYNIAGKIGAQISSMKEVEAALVDQEKQAELIVPTPQQDAAPANKPSKKISTKTKAIAGGLLGGLGVALMFGKDIIEGMVNFFKNPLGIISNLLGSLGEGIVEWFQDGGFKDFFLNAFEEGKKELIKTFDDLKNIFKVLIGDPVANLIDDVKLSFISVSIDGLKMLPDWLKGDSVKGIEKNLEKAKGDIQAGKETRAAETQAARDSLKKSNAAPAPGGGAPQKQTSEDLKSQQPQQAPVAAPKSSPAPAPASSVVTASGAPVTTGSGDALKTGAETQDLGAQAIPIAADKSAESSAAAGVKSIDDYYANLGAGRITVRGEQMPVERQQVMTEEEKDYHTKLSAENHNRRKKQTQAVPEPTDVTPSILVTSSGTPVTTGSGDVIKTGAGSQAQSAQAIPTSKEPPPSIKVATSVEKPTVGGTTTPSVGPDDKEIMEMIKKHEGVRTKPYKDSLGLWTVGVGHLIGDGKTLPPEWNRELTMAEVDDLFYKDYMSHKKAAMKIPGYDLVNAKAQGALIDLTFNMGNTWFKKWPNFVKNLSQGNTIEAAASLEDSNWFKQVKSRAVTIVSLIKEGASNAMGMAPSPSTGVQTAQAGADVNAAKKQQTGQTVINVNNNVTTAVKVGAPQGSSTTIARPVGTA